MDGLHSEVEKVRGSLTDVTLMRSNLRNELKVFSNVAVLVSLDFITDGLYSNDL